MAVQNSTCQMVLLGHEKSPNLWLQEGQLQNSLLHPSCYWNKHSFWQDLLSIHIDPVRFLCCILFSLGTCLLPFNFTAKHWKVPRSEPHPNWLHSWNLWLNSSRRPIANMFVKRCRVGPIIGITTCMSPWPSYQVHNDRGIGWYGLSQRTGIETRNRKIGLTIAFGPS